MRYIFILFIFYPLSCSLCELDKWYKNLRWGNDPRPIPIKYKGECLDGYAEGRGKTFFYDYDGFLNKTVEATFSKGDMTEGMVLRTEFQPEPNKYEIQVRYFLKRVGKELYRHGLMVSTYTRKGEVVVVEIEHIYKDKFVGFQYSENFAANVFESGRRINDKLLYGIRIDPNTINIGTYTNSSKEIISNMDASIAFNLVLMPPFFKDTGLHLFYQGKWSSENDEPFGSGTMIVANTDNLELLSHISEGKFNGSLMISGFKRCLFNKGKPKYYSANQDHYNYAPCKSNIKMSDVVESYIDKNSLTKYLLGNTKKIYMNFVNGSIKKRSVFGDVIININNCKVDEFKVSSQSHEFNEVFSCCSFNNKKTEIIAMPAGEYEIEYSCAPYGKKIVRNISIIGKKSITLNIQ